MEKKTKIKFNIIIILAIILLSIATIPKTLQEDTYYMIKAGEYICQNGMEVIEKRIEPFAWHEGMIYTYPHWLLDVIFYFIFSIFDIFGMYAFAVIIGIIIYLLIYYTNSKVGKNNVISAIITIASIYLLSGFITARAQVITYICCILTILFIERFLETSKKRYLVGLVLVPILLANCHAALFPIYFVIYLPYIAEYLISFATKQEILERLLKRKSKKVIKLQDKMKHYKGKNIEQYKTKYEKRIQKLQTKITKLEGKTNQFKQEEGTKDRKIIIKRNSNMKWIILLFVLCIFTGLLTPLKDIPYTYMIKSIQGNTMNFISEHQAVAPIHSISILVMFFIIVALLFSNKIKIRLQDIFMLLGISILGLVSYKQFPIFFIGTMCIINKLSCMVINENFKEKVQRLLKKILSIKGIVYITLILIILFLVQYQNIAPQSYVDSNEYPVQAATWLKANVDIKNMKLFNDFNYGSYLLFKDIPVFIDGRADAYDPVFNGRKQDSFTDYMMTSSLQVWYEEKFEEYGITHIMTKTNSNFNIFLQRNIDYKNIYNDGTFSIYERNK